MIDFLQQAVKVTPSDRQKAWFDLEMYAFMHFGMNTFTNREWGDGTEDESLFRPTNLDTDQWARVLKAAGMKGLVLTAKHHDGFCLWPTKTTTHSIASSPLAGRDVVREAADSCRKYGLKFGFYLSPWDRNCALYGTDAYNDFFCAQLTELLTNYGDIFYVWFDNACGEGPTGKKQVYDFPRYIRLIRHLQPNAVIFNDFGPDIRWIGNESGKSRAAEWAVVPHELCYLSELQSPAGPLHTEGTLTFLYNTAEEIGSVSTILYSRGLTFTPAEVDTSLRPGWFYHPGEEPKSLQQLFQIYLTSVGHNACLNLNVPPDASGRISPEDEKRLMEFRTLLDLTFGKKMDIQVTEDDSSPSQPLFHVSWEGETFPKIVVLKEDLSYGQRVESFMISPGSKEGFGSHPFYQGKTIGHQEICCLTDPFADQNPLTREELMDRGLDIRITAGRGGIHLREIACFA